MSDSYHTGWIERTITFASVGAPATVTFTITDVGDEIYSSILAIDDISF